MSLPSDPFILLSYINTLLRDQYATLEDLCKALDVDPKQLTDTLAAAGFEYLPSVNQFR